MHGLDYSAYVVELDHGPLAGRGDIRRIEQTPLRRRVPFGSVYELLAWAASRYADRPALVCLPDGRPEGGAECINFAEYGRMVNRTARAFAARLAGRDEGVAYLLPNVPEAYLTLWAAEAVAFAVPVNPLLSAEVIAAILSAARVRILVTAGSDVDPQIWNVAQEVRRRVSRPMDLVVVTRQASPGKDACRFDELLERADEHPLAPGSYRGGDSIAAYFHTGGTTGIPKLCAHPHSAQIANVAMTALALGLGPGDVVMTGLPLYHVNAALATGLTSVLAGAASLLPGPKGYRNPALLCGFWHIIERFRVTHFSAVPTVYGALLDEPIGSADVSSLKYGLCGAAPLAPSLIHAFEERTGLRILEGYGLTEATAVASLNPRDGERRPGSIGIPLPYQEARVAILGEGSMIERDARRGEVGTLLLRGPNLTAGYKERGQNRELWIAEGWLNTGDLARFDDDGYLYLAGRVKDLIIRGGHNIDPAVVEDSLTGHPDVERVAAVGRPDAYAGEVPVAYVQLRKGASLHSGELVSYARNHVAEKGAAPVEVIVVDEIPLTGVGKIFKPPLRRDITERAYREVLEGALGPAFRVGVDVGESSARGLEVRISIRGPRRDDTAVADALRAYSIPWLVTWQVPDADVKEDSAPSA